MDWYLSKQGSDQCGGKEPGDAVRSMGRAAALAAAGDTIKVGPGFAETIGYEEFAGGLAARGVKIEPWLGFVATPDVKAEGRRAKAEPTPASN